MVEISEYVQMVDFIRVWLFARGRVILSHCYFFDVWVMKFHLAGQLTTLKELKVTPGYGRGSCFRVNSSLHIWHCGEVILSIKGGLYF